MQHGVMVFPTEYSVDPADLASEVESRGFESLWFPEHTHIPVPDDAAGRGEPGKPAIYSDLYDPFVALTVAACATSTLRVATGVCLIAQRDPITTAKVVATLDRVSGGRFLFGVGAGVNRAEMAGHGVDPRTRMRRMAEHVKAMKQLWTEEVAEFHGEFVDFDPSWARPKPLRRPHPPILVGGMGPGVEDRVLDFGDEWLPQGVGLDEVAGFSARVKALHQRAEDSGRGEIPISLFGPEAGREAVGVYSEAGIHRLVHVVQSTDRDSVLRALDSLDAIVELSDM